MCAEFTVGVEALRDEVHHHAGVFEGVAKSQFPPQGSGFQKSKPRICAVVKGFTPLTTLAGQVADRKGMF